MKGKMLIFGAGTGASITVHPLSAPPPLNELQAAVGGYIEPVPYFSSIEWDGKIQPCAVFCNEDGKNRQLQRNAYATALWSVALRRRHPRGELNDVLLGTVVVIFGDEELMAEL